MTQHVLNISDSSLVPGLKMVLSRLGGVEEVHEIKDYETSEESFEADFREAVAHAKDFKDGKMKFATWEETMNEL